MPVGAGTGSTRRPGSADRALALGSELRRLHDRIRDLLGDARDGLDPGMGAASLGADLERVVREGAPGPVVLRHLEGIDAIMESHLRHEERELVPLLDAIDGGGPDLPESFWGGR